MKKSMKSLNNQSSPLLRFTPTAWAKLLFLRDAGDTEIGGLGISRAGDPLLLDDIGLVRQTCTPVHVAFDDEAVADFFDAQVDAGRQPHQFGRVWVHTHPGSSPQPSGTDEETFTRVFGPAEWALMFILARGGQSYARLRFNVGPGADVMADVDVDFSHPFAASDAQAWQCEYEACVYMPPPEPPRLKARVGTQLADFDVRKSDAWYDDVEFEPTYPETQYGYIREF
jgi:proteasome lid subunit RPN8/RPN11